MFQTTVKRRGMGGVFLSLLLCCAMIAGSILVAPSTAEAAGTKEQVDKLIQDWTNRYGKSDIWKVRAASPEEVQKAKKAGTGYRVLPQKGHIEQTKALRKAVDRILKEYDLTPSMLNAYYPVFSFWADKNDKPYWQIVFNVNSKEHKMLKTITVQVNAVDGSIRYIKQGSDG